MNYSNGRKVRDICAASVLFMELFGERGLTISTVDQSPLEMGKMAAQVFLEKINNRDKKKSLESKVVLMPKLLIRQSSTRKTN